NVTFLSNVSDYDIVNHFQTALAFIMSNMDDFGIVAVEAMAAGTPVIAYKKGGALDYMIPGKTGLFFERQTVSSLRVALEAAAAKSFNYEAIAEHANEFSSHVFSRNVKEFIKNCLRAED
ncbi:MAG TPA: glycosyltransferase, partial [Verrucomicrobiae bacterium]|nr:glycosyltransferase [Verrucomicrobiae bacterium]